MKSKSRKADKLLSYKKCYALLVELGRVALCDYQRAKDKRDERNDSLSRQGVSGEVIFRLADDRMGRAAATLNAYGEVAARVFGVGHDAYLTEVNHAGKKQQVVTDESAKT